MQPGDLSKQSRIQLLERGQKRSEMRSGFRKDYGEKAGKTLNLSRGVRLRSHFAVSLAPTIWLFV